MSGALRGWLIIWAVFALGLGIGLLVPRRIGHPLVLAIIGLVIWVFAFLSLFSVGILLMLPAGFCFGAALRAARATAG